MKTGPGFSNQFGGLVSAEPFPGSNAPPARAVSMSNSLANMDDKVNIQGDGEIGKKYAVFVLNLLLAIESDKFINIRILKYPSSWSDNNSTHQNFVYVLSSSSFKAFKFYYVMSNQEMQPSNNDVIRHHSVNVSGISPLDNT